MKLYPTRMSTNKATIVEWSDGRCPMQGTIPSPVGTGRASIAKFDRRRKQGLNLLPDIRSVLPSPLNRRPLQIRVVACFLFLGGLSLPFPPADLEPPLTQPL